MGIWGVRSVSFIPMQSFRGGGGGGAEILFSFSRVLHSQVCFQNKK